MKPSILLRLALVMTALFLAGSSLAQNPTQEELDSREKFEVVLIHGLGSDAAVWDEVLPFLKNTFEVKTFEMAGHGKTQPVMDPTIETETDRLEQFILDEGFDYPVLVGHGLGGMVAMVYAIRHPAAVHRLILLDTAPKQLATDEEKAEVALQLANDYDRFVASRFLNMTPDEAVTDRIVDTALRTDSATFISLLMSSFDFDVTGDLYDMSVPMLVIGSELMFPADADSRHMLEHYGYGAAKSLSFKRMGATGHFMMLERPVLLSSVLLAFGVTADYQFEH